jgi:hypothetical protein
MLRAASLIGLVLLSGNSDFWSRKYTPTFGEYVLNVTNSWYHRYGVDVVPLTAEDGTVKLQVMIPTSKEGKYTRELAMELESRFKSKVRQYIKTYWAGRGITEDTFVYTTYETFGTGIK